MFKIQIPISMPSRTQRHQILGGLLKDVKVEGLESGLDELSLVYFTLIPDDRLLLDTRRDN